MRSSHTSRRSLTTSSPPSSHLSLPRAPAQEARRGSRPRTPPSPGSPTWSTASTADAGPSPSLHALPVPRLPERVLALLRTPSPADPEDLDTERNGDDSRFVTASWGSPYPRSDTSHLRLSSLSSEPSEGSPIHHLELHTPFLRPAPFFPDLREKDQDDKGSHDSQSEGLVPSPHSFTQQTSLVSATVLANRARRPARGLTEDWIRQHTTGDFGSEARLWLSDNSSAGDSENSSLSGSVFGGDHEEEEEHPLRTPRAILLNRHTRSPGSLVSTNRRPRRKRTRHPSHPSSLETLRESDLNRPYKRDNTRSSKSSIPSTANSVVMDYSASLEMDSSSHISEPAAIPTVATDAAVDVTTRGPPTTPPTAKPTAAHAPDSIPLLTPSTPPLKATLNGRCDADGIQTDASLDPLGGDLAVSKMSASPRKTPRRIKKKLSWKGKNIIVLLPLDEQRGKPGKAPKPLPKDTVDNMLQSWKELGYDIRGFDLNPSISPNDYDFSGVSSRSMSRPSWPDEEDLVLERAHRKYPVQLPDLNAWKNYVAELNEAKLRALGVSFGNEEPPLPPAISPGAAASISRQPSATMYPPLPFSPPIPTSSASSNKPFNFPAAFVPGTGGFIGSSAAQSPSILSAASPNSFGMGSKYNRQSISIPAGGFQMPPLQTTPGGFSPQTLLLQQGLARGGSPSLAALSSVMSPTSPFTPDGSFTSPPLHQRHQSLQYPMMQYPQLQTSARASPRLQELLEVEDEVEDKPLSKSPSKTPEPAATRPFIRHNASLSLQNEIDAAEYHLEEQFRSQFEHDRDYSPHGGKDSADTFGVDANAKSTTPQHNRGLSVQFAPHPPIERFRDDTENRLPLHHPRPHSRGHSLANVYYAEPDEMRNGANGSSFTKTSAVLDNAKKGTVPDRAYDIHTISDDSGTPIQGLDYGNALHDEQTQNHQRSFSNTSNPWSENGSFSGKRSSMRQVSHGSKASMSSLNVDAPEFKFDPGASSTFQPLGGQFQFGSSIPNSASEPYQPSIFQAGLAPNAPPSANSSHFSFPATVPASSKINVNAPAFSPGQSEFSFSSIGPKFRPDAPAFTPLHSFTDSLTSPIHSGNESVSGANRTSSIFGNIDLNLSDASKPTTKRSKAVPIIRPSSSHSPQPVVSQEQNKNNEPQYDREGRITDDSRVKRAKATVKDDGNDEILFAERNNNALSVPLATPSPAPADVSKQPEDETKNRTEDKTGGVDEDKSENAFGAEADPTSDVMAEQVGDISEPETPSVTTNLDIATNAELEKSYGEGESALAAEDTTLSSTAMSESTDAAKLPATISPSELSPLPGSVPWTPFEFRSEADVSSFNAARPFGENVFGHKKSLSATAKPFTPGASFQGSIVDNDVPDEYLPSQDIILTTEAVEEDRKAMSEATSVAPVDAFTFSSPPPPPPPATDKPKGLSASRYATASSPPLPPKSFGLSVSRDATSSPPPLPNKYKEPVIDAEIYSEQQFVMPVPENNLNAELNAGTEADAAGVDYEPTFEEIDDIMRHLNEIPAQGVNKFLDATAAPWDQPAVPLVQNSPAATASHAPLKFSPSSPSRSYQQSLTEQPQQPLLSTELEDPFIDPPLSAAQSLDARGMSGKGHASGDTISASEWEGDFTGEEQLKLESRVNFFDGHVNNVVSGILAARLGPLETSLDRIQHAIASMTRGVPSSRREYRSNSGEMPESDADDEDDNMPPVPRRSMSPRRDRRMEQMRAVVLDALATYQVNGLPAQLTTTKEDVSGNSVAAILESLADVKEQFGKSLRLDFRGEDLRNIVEDAVERRIPLTPEAPVTGLTVNEDDTEMRTNILQARVSELEDRLRLKEEKMESVISSRRVADDQAAELRRQLELAETKVEVEIMNRSVFDQRIVDLEDKLKNQEEKTATELSARHNAEDRLAEVQRLLRISSEEEMRLREAVDEREEKLKALDETSNNDRLRLASLEASQVNGEQTQSDLQNRLNSIEAELREKSQESRHWRAEAERAIDLSQRQGSDLVQTATELKHLKKVIDTLGTQLEENKRLREAWRIKFVALQEDMARAAREVAEESARFIKREQTLLARHEVLDAKLQAEARTRERLESELERLEGGERQAMRAVSDCKRLEALITELRTENHKLQQTSVRYQTEAEEARKSAAREVQRARDSVQAEVEEANRQVIVVRGDLEDQIGRVHGQLDQVKLDSDTATARFEMLLKEAETTKQAALEKAEIAKRNAVEENERQHQKEVEDLRAQYERKINNTTEDAQRAEQNLLERLSISTSKTEHLQDRVAHLEEKLEIAREAAQAAAKAAKVSSVLDTADISSFASPTSGTPLQSAAAAKTLHHGLDLPEKISPQALRESILVLQEQLQQREQRIEELEHALDKVDPEADIKITKRDDEITWLRELLDVRHSDLKDIITALGRHDHDPDRVRDAVIRLQANLQMEEQERERAMNGGSAIKLPAIAASFRDAATPRVAQAVGPLAAAWGSWRKARESNASNMGNTFSSLSEALLSSPGPASVSKRGGQAESSTATPSRTSASSISSRAGPVEAQLSGGDSSFLSGLMTPPTSGMRQTPPSRQPDQHDSLQPTAFSSTGRRYTGGQPSSRRTSHTDNKTALVRDVVSTPPPPLAFRRASRGQPVTPPMMRTSAYDSDAHAEEFDDAAYFDD